MHHSFPGSGRKQAVLVFAMVLSAFTPRQAIASPSLVVHAQRVLLPLVTEQDLDAGVVESDASRGTFALVLDVSVPAGDGDGWALYVRSDRPTFGAEGLDKPCSDLEWKLDDSPGSEYRSLDEHESMILARPEGGSARITLDVRVRVDWSTESGPYQLPVVFRAGPY